jgi:hypothetical protein
MTRTISAAAAIGFLIGGTTSLITGGWTAAFIAAGVVTTLLAALLLIRRIWLANKQTDQIFDDELDDPDPFNTRLRVYPDTDTTGETR